MKTLSNHITSLLKLVTFISLIGTCVPSISQTGYFDTDIDDLTESDGADYDVYEFYPEENDDTEYDTYNIQYADGSSYQGTSKQEYNDFIKKHNAKQPSQPRAYNPQNSSNPSYGDNLLPNRGNTEQAPYSYNNNPNYKPYKNRPRSNYNNSSTNELQDFGIAATRQLYTGNFHAPTPTSIPGGRVVTTRQLQSMVMNGQYGQINTLIFDVLDGPQHLPGAIPASQGAAAGNFSDNTQLRMGQFLSQVTGGNKNVNMVYYCQSVNCWMSYNAALRAINLGYKKVYWYRGGIDAWKQQGLSVQNIAYNNYQ